MEGIENSETLLKDYILDLLVFFATVTNVGIICFIILKKSTKLDSGYLLVLHLAGKLCNLF